MADSKISAFPSASALNAVDLLPVIQGGANKQITWGTALTAIPAPVSIGTAAITDTGVELQSTNSLNGYIQSIIQNTSSGVSASADIIVNNNLGTASTYYGDFGINSSGFTGTGNFNAANATYLYASNGDLVLGTITANAVHIVVGGLTAADAITIASSGAVTIAQAATFSSTINNITLTAPATAATITVANNKTFTVSNTITLAGTDGQTYTFPSTSATIARTDAANTFNGSQTVQNALSVAGTAYTFGALPSGATTTGTVITIPATTYTVTGTNTATAFQANYFGVPTITNASAGTVTDLFGTVLAGPAVAAGSLIATRVHTLGVLDSTSASTSTIGAFVVAAAFGTASSSVSIGGGNVMAGGVIQGNTHWASGASARLGFLSGTGVGGTVTQLTSRSTGVTLNAPTGQITGNNASLGAQTAVTFTVTNSSCGANDVPWLVLASGGAATTSAWVSAVAAGSFNVTLFNENTITADTTTPVFNFVIIKGAVS